MKTLIIIPTFNEVDNIENIINEILKVESQVSILVVDDNSPDGTGELVKKIQSQNSQVFLLSRSKKEGLGRAYIAGFNWGLERGFELLVEMDADFSHRPIDLPKLLNKVRSHEYDFAMGSRYVEGGSTVNWGLIRKIVSKGGSLYSRLILGYPVNDWTGGFNAWSSKSLQAIRLAEVQSNGYGFQVELKYRALVAQCRGVEVPIIFEDRRVGKSKMSMGIILEAFYRVWWFRFCINSCLKK